MNPRYNSKEKETYKKLRKLSSKTLTRIADVAWAKQDAFIFQNPEIYEKEDVDWVWKDEEGRNYVVGITPLGKKYESLSNKADQISVIHDILAERRNGKIMLGVVTVGMAISTLAIDMRRKPMESLWGVAGSFFSGIVARVVLDKKAYKTINTGPVSQKSANKILLEDLEEKS